MSWILLSLTVFFKAWPGHLREFHLAIPPPEQWYYPWELILNVPQSLLALFWRSSDRLVPTPKLPYYDTYLPPFKCVYPGHKVA
jgi:hypothetical protein